MPPTADLESAFEEAVKGLVFGVLACVLLLATDWDKVDEYMNATFLQWLLAIIPDLLLMALCIMSFFSFVLVVYYLPRRFWLSRILMGFSCLLCLCGVIYYGDVFSASRSCNSLLERYQFQTRAILCVWCFICLFAANYCGM